MMVSSAVAIWTVGDTVATGVMMIPVKVRLIQMTIHITDGGVGSG